jgi:protease-4
MAADKIYSEPNTLTGSIGVFGVIPYLKILPIKTESVPILSLPMRILNIILFKRSYTLRSKFDYQKCEGTYKRFVHFVTQNRKQTFEQIDSVGGGRVWSGTRAKQIGLVDELGTLNDAVKFAAQKAGLNLMQFLLILKA